MTNPELTEIIAVVDRSGSMEEMKAEAIGGFNGFLEKQKNLPGRADFTLVLFDHEYKLVHDGVDISEVEPLNESTYYPRGTTALLDAVGRTIDAVGERLSDTPEDERPGVVIFCVLTDGMENASHDYNLEKVREMVKTQENEYNWHFLFLAQGLGAFHAGHDMGLGHVSTQYAASAIGTRQAYTDMTYTVTAMRTAEDT